ncbi:MAG TPA: 1,2-phenylacetyl-CoA epoxidase subunit PaaC [Hyphomicrobiaceae bacterium]|jgi:ring-1,2-phenylacetyl-CoA epoxidase subunit PaaC
MATAHYRYLLRLADNALVLGHRLTEWSSRAPTLEEDIALSNIALDLIGQARALYGRACALAGDGRGEDQLAFLRDAHEFLNVQLAERPNGDFADTMARQLCCAAFAVPLWAALTHSLDAELAGVAAKAGKECAYHLRHSSEWVIRLGDGTAESHRRMQRAIDDIWMFTGELFEADDVERAMVEAGVGADASKLRPAWNDTMSEVLIEATLQRPADGWMISGGRRGTHTEHLGHMLAEMQFLQRAYPGATW